MGSSSSGGVLLLYLLVFASWVHVQSDEGSHLSVVVADKGFNFFVQTLLMQKAEISLPLHIPDINKNTRIPIIGVVHMGALNITLLRFHVASSTIKIGDTGILITLSGATVNLSFDWEYSYKARFIPITVKDRGNGTVQVDGMDVGLTISLRNDQGSLQLSVPECGSYVKDISIVLEGGASWLYQRFIDAFEDLFTSAVEEAISNKIKEGTESFNSVLHSFPKEFPISNFAALNITLVGNPELSDSSLKLAIDGLFSAKEDIMGSKSHNSYLWDSLSCKNPPRMIMTSVNEHVLESAALIYFKADKLHWVVNKIPGESLLNTAEWKYIIPQLYKQYPDDQINLNISVQSPPIIKFEKSQVALTVPLDIIINVLDGAETVPVICVSVVIGVAATPEISGNALAGTIKLEEFTMSLKWSKVGNLHINLVKSLISAALRTVILPLVNMELRKGIPLPVIHGYVLQNSTISYYDSWIVVCTDLAPMGGKLLPFLVPETHQVHNFWMYSN